MVKKPTFNQTQPIALRFLIRRLQILHNHFHRLIAVGLEDIVLDVDVLERVVLSEELEEILHTEAFFLDLLAGEEKAGERVDELVLDRVVGVFA